MTTPCPVHPPSPAEAPLSLSWGRLAWLLCLSGPVLLLVLGLINIATP